MGATRENRSDFRKLLMLRSILKTVLPDRIQHLMRRLRSHRNGEAELSYIDTLHPDIAIDVGANLGLYAQRLSARASHVHAFEPNSDMVRYLHKVMPENVTVHRVALSDQQGQAELRIPVDAQGVQLDGLASVSHGNMLSGYETTERTVATARLDDLADTFDGKIDFIKIDVEGHEQAVLDGARNVLGRHKPIVLVETEARHGADVVALFGFMHALGYRGHLWRNPALEPVDVAEFLDLQSRGVPEQAGYVNNVIFVAQA